MLLSGILLFNKSCYSLFFSGILLLNKILLFSASIRHSDFKQIRMAPLEVRTVFERLGWKRVVGFQTRQPLHRPQFEIRPRASRLGIENASTLRKQDMMFAILKELAEQDVPITGDGVLEDLREGVEIGHVCSFMGLKALSNGIVHFENVKVPADNVLITNGSMVQPNQPNASETSGDSQLKNANGRYAMVATPRVAA